MTDTWKKVLILNLPYLLFVYLFDKLCQAVRLAPGLDASEKFLHLSQGFTEAFSSGLPSLHPLDLLVGIAGAVIVRLAVYAKGKNARKYRKSIEYGSARLGTAADIAPYVDPVPDWNIPLTQTEKLTMSSRPKNPKYARNKNILVIGGSGKTRFFVKPSLMQMRSSYVVTDPKGQLLSKVGTMLRRGAPKLDENGKPMRDARGKVIYEPYRIKDLNTINFKKSMKYNPFAYIRSEKDILKLVNVIIANTKGDGEKSSEDFWVKAERLLYCALIGYIWYEAEPEEKNFLTLLELINASEAREDDEEFQSPVDILFSKLEKEHPDHFAVKQYRKFKLAAGKTLKSILISCGARLAPFDIAELREIMSDDELELDTLGDRKTALFLIMSDTDTTFNFVIAMLQSQLFNLLCDKADDVYGGRLPVHVRCLLDEFANIGQIPNFDKLIATIRNREISASIILQSQSQLKTIYKDAADTIPKYLMNLFSDIPLKADILCGTMYLLEVQCMNIDDWKSQIKRGTLEFCILLMIKQRPSYGYEIISTLEKYPILAAKENTIYPLLRRLMKEDYVSSSWQESVEGLPPRKYYSVTDKGLEYISAMSKEWNNLLNALDEIKGE